MSIEKEICVRLTIMDGDIPIFESIVSKLVNMPRVGYNKPFSPREFELIDYLAEMCNVSKQPKESVLADRSTAVC